MSLIFSKPSKDVVIYNKKQKVTYRRYFFSYQWPCADKVYTFPDGHSMIYVQCAINTQTQDAKLIDIITLTPKNMSLISNIEPDWSIRDVRFTKTSIKHCFKSHQVLRFRNKDRNNIVLNPTYKTNKGPIEYYVTDMSDRVTCTITSGLLCPKYQNVEAQVEASFYIEPKNLFTYYLLYSKYDSTFFHKLPSYIDWLNGHPIIARDVDIYRVYVINHSWSFKN